MEDRCAECGNTNIFDGAHWMSPSGEFYHPRCAYKYTGRLKVGNPIKDFKNWDTKQR